MEQAPKAAEAPQTKGKKTWVIVAGVALIVILVVAGLYFAGYLFPRPSGTPVSIWENPGAGCTTGTDCGYRPNPLNITAGTTVRWRNDGNLPHSVTSCSTNSPSTTGCPTMNDPGLPQFDSGATDYIDGGQEWPFKFDNPGTYHYYCRVHQSMRGTVNVAS